MDFLQNKRIVRHLILIIFTLFFSATAAANQYQGELEVLVFDNFEQNSAKTKYLLHINNEIYVLNVPESLDQGKMLTGTHVIVQGEEKILKSHKKIHIDVESIIFLDKTNDVSLENRNAIAILVNFNDKKASATLSATELDQTLYLNNNSTRANYLYSSFQQVNFVRDTNQDGKADIYSVNLNYNIGTSCNYSTWASDALNAVRQAGINTSLYKHRMFVIPKNASCSWAGLGNVGCSTTCNTWIKAYESTSTFGKLAYTHELGHNLGMRHASTDTNNDGSIESEYGDFTCFMGNGNNPQANAAHRDMMKWFVPFPNKIVSVTASGQYILYPLDQAENNNLQVLRIKATSTKTYYISFRRNITPFPSSSTHVNRVSVHYMKSGDGRSYFIKSLGVGETFKDTVNNLIVSVGAISSSTAAVTVNF